MPSREVGEQGSYMGTVPSECSGLMRRPHSMWRGARWTSSLNFVHWRGDHEAHKLLHLGLGPGGRKGVHLAAEILPAESRLVHAAGTGAPEGTALPQRPREQRKAAPGRKALERQQHSGAGVALDAIEYGHVGAQGIEVDDKAGGGDFRPLQQKGRTCHA